MNTPTDGGPAFPTQDAEVLGGVSMGKPGMSLRDWFAGMALQGMYSNSSLVDNFSNHGIMASESYECADAMLVARNKSNP